MQRRKEETRKGGKAGKKEIGKGGRDDWEYRIPKREKDSLGTGQTAAVLVGTAANGEGKGGLTEKGNEGLNLGCAEAVFLF